MSNKFPAISYSPFLLRADFVNILSKTALFFANPVYIPLQNGLLEP
jgi:hypothetical protein